SQIFNTRGIIMAPLIGRREFLRATAAMTATAMTSAPLLSADAKPKLKKAVKYHMVKLNGSHLEKLELVKKCGFLGVELDCPGTDSLDELVKASKETGIACHGVINSMHWKPTHCLSHPDPKVRAHGLETLIGALKDAQTVGADTALLVP